MPIIGVTGGIASGKSTVTRMLADHLEDYSGRKISIFSADSCAHQLLEQDGGVLDQIASLFGPSVIDENGSIDRAALREIVFESDERREDLESILHPKIRQTWVSEAEQIRASGDYLIAEIPLLYETNSDKFIDCVIVVEAGTQIQLERLSSKRGWSLETARRVIDAQMSAEQKMLRADFLILNNFTEKLLDAQVALAAAALITRYA